MQDYHWIKNKNGKWEMLYGKWKLESEIFSQRLMSLWLKSPQSEIIVGVESTKNV